MGRCATLCWVCGVVFWRDDSSFYRRLFLHIVTYLFVVGYKNLYSILNYIEKQFMV